MRLRPYVRRGEGVSARPQLALELHRALGGHSPETPLKNVKADVLLNKLSFELWDSDVEFDDLIGGCAIAITAEQFDGLTRQVTCPPTPSNVSVTLRYRIEKH